eukprot:1144854-Pelagomonas_calceolata.AAC.7
MALADPIGDPTHPGCGGNILVLALPFDEAVCLHGALDAVHWEDGAPVGDAAQACVNVKRS